jgi:MFS family permease
LQCRTPLRQNTAFPYTRHVIHFPSATPDDAAEPLRHHTPFKLFWCASVASTIALQMQIVAVGWQVYQLTHSAFDLGIVGLVQFIPSLILVFVVGHVADRFDRRNVARVSSLVEAPLPPRWQWAACRAGSAAR